MEAREILLRSDSNWARPGCPDLGGLAWNRFLVELPPGNMPFAPALPSSNRRSPA